MTAKPALAFREIENVMALETALAEARGAGQPVMLDFTADWCISCKEMEEYTFPDPGVVAALQPFMLLRADVTDNNADDQALLEYFRSFGPPTIAFFDRSGAARENFKLVGFVPADEFRTHVSNSPRSREVAAMAKARPVLVTAALSAAAVLGYVSLSRPLGPPETVPLRPTGVADETLREAAPAELGSQTAARVLARQASPGEQQSISSWPGKPILINFWATWCGPCLREIPMLKELQTGAARSTGRRHRDRQARPRAEIRRQT